MVPDTPVQLSRFCQQDLTTRYYSESDSTWISNLDFDNELYQLYTAEEFAGGRSQRTPNTVGIHTHGSGWTPLNEHYKLPEATMPDPVDEDGDGIPDEPVVIVKAEGAVVTDPEGRKYYDIYYLEAYGHEGDPCTRCGRPMVRTVIGGRSSYWCPRCQRRPRSATEPKRFLSDKG